MSNLRLLIVHPDPASQALLRSMLYKAGGQVDEAGSDREALRMLERDGADLVIEGVDPSDPEALELLQYVRRKHPQVPVILLFSAPNPERTREAIQRGATAVLRFPIPATELRAAVSQALERPWTTGSAPVPAVNGSLPDSARYTNGHTNSSNGNGHTPAPDRPLAAEALIGHDPALRHALELAAAIAPTRTPVLVQGEAGTGKTSVARLMHQRSPRADGPFVRLACADLNPVELEKALFGQAPGGRPDRSGKLAQAHGGTLYLDSVEALPPEVQFRLVRAIKDQTYEPVDSDQTCRADIRFVLSSSEDLAHLVARGRLHQEFFDCISSVSFKLPPLRQRGSDIELLAQHFRTRFARDLNKEVLGFMPEALNALRQHSWPGNVRELESAIERSVVFCRGPKIALAHFSLNSEAPRATRQRLPSTGPHMAVGIRPLKEALEEPEKLLILQALEALNWNRQETARVLDINRTTLYKKMKKYGLLDAEAPCPA
jgi:DNA-binding NtrC family response regulator